MQVIDLAHDYEVGRGLSEVRSRISGSQSREQARLRRRSMTQPQPWLPRQARRYEGLRRASRGRAPLGARAALPDLDPPDLDPADRCAPERSGAQGFVRDVHPACGIPVMIPRSLALETIRRRHVKFDMVTRGFAIPLRMAKFSESGLLDVMQSRPCCRTTPQ